MRNILYILLYERYNGHHKEIISYQLKNKPVNRYEKFYLCMNILKFLHMVSQIYENITSFSWLFSKKKKKFTVQTT